MNASPSSHTPSSSSPPYLEVSLFQQMLREISHNKIPPFDRWGELFVHEQENLQTTIFLLNDPTVVRAMVKAQIKIKWAPLRKSFYTLPKQVDVADLDLILEAEIGKWPAAADVPGYILTNMDDMMVTVDQACRNDGRVDFFQWLVADKVASLNTPWNRHRAGNLVEMLGVALVSGKTDLTNALLVHFAKNQILWHDPTTSYEIIGFLDEHLEDHGVLPSTVHGIIPFLERDGRISPRLHAWFNKEGLLQHVEEPHGARKPKIM